MKNINLTLLNRPKFEMEYLTLYEKYLKPEAFVRKCLTWGLARTTEDDYEVISSTKIPGKMSLLSVEFTCDRISYEFLLKQFQRYANSLHDKDKIEELEVTFEDKTYILEGVFTSELSCNDIDISLDEKEYSGVLYYDDIKRIY
jgi:hypothetical protein